MIRKFKMLGLALVAVLALTAVAASGASAEKKYTASSYPTSGTAASALGNDVFETEAGKVECKSSFAGSLNAASSEMVITPTYSECKAFGFLNATVSGCKYKFTTPKSTGVADVFTAAVDVTSPCTIVASTCHVTVPNQGPLNSVTITNDTAAGDVTVKANVSGITYYVVKDGIGCPFVTDPNKLPEHKTGATYKQTNAVTFDSTNGANIHVG